MEHFLHRLPVPRSAFMRIVITTGMVTFCFLLLLGLYQRHGLLGFYLLLPAVFAASVWFERGAGLYATMLSTVLLYALLTPAGGILLPADLILPLLLFIIIALSFALLSEALRRGLDRAAAAEQAKELLLQELGHRTKNSLSMVISMLSMQARSKTNPDTRRALEKAVARIRAVASAHEHFRPVELHGRIEMRAYLEQLCAHLGDVFRELRPIAVKVSAIEIYLLPDQAIPLGLIVNELVTNSLKHAFPDDRAGKVDVLLSQDERLILVVRDNGIGCDLATPGGLGSRLTRLLAQQLAASIVWERSESGCQVRLVLAAA